MAKEKKGISAIGTAIVAAALGAAAAVLSDKKNRKVIKKTILDVVDEGGKKFDQARKYIDTTSTKKVGKKAIKAKTKKRIVKKAKSQAK